MILLNSVHKSYKEDRNAIRYSKDQLTQIILIDALRSRGMNPNLTLEMRVCL